MKNKIKKYFVFIFIFTCLLGIISIKFSEFIPEKSISKTKMLFKEEYSEEQLLTYSELGKSFQVINNISEQLSLDKDYVSSMIDLNIINNTKLIEITVSDTNKDNVSLVSDSFNNEYITLLKTNFETIDVKLVDPNTLETVNAKPEFVVIFTTICAFIFSTLLVLIFGNNDKKIKNHNDIKECLDMKPLGVIPRYIDDSRGEKKVDLNIIPVKVLREPNSLMAENYRMIRTNLDFLDMKVISFTSTSASEGKSSTIINLALTFAMIGKKVLLIDCDLRKPSVHSWLKLNRTQGVSDILLYQRTFEYANYVQKVNIPNSEYKLDVLTSGSKVSNTSELFTTPDFVNLIEQAKKNYDLILIDCPPISLVTDAVIISKLSDGVVYVIEYDKYNVSVIKSAIDSLKDVDANLLGSIITKVNYAQQRKLYGYKDDYYEKEYM